jgi:hypothetical protein
MPTVEEVEEEARSPYNVPFEERRYLEELGEGDPLRLARATDMNYDGDMETDDEDDEEEEEPSPKRTRHENTENLNNNSNNVFSYMTMAFDKLSQKMSAMTLRNKNFKNN